MNVTDRLKSLDFKGRDFPILKGDVKMTLKNVHNGKTEVFEKHNLVTNALSDIFGNNYGGLVNYNSFANLYKTYLGGVLVFASALDDTDPTDYGIPAYTSNAVTAHAGQTPLTSQNDDTTRGNPDDTSTTLTSGSTKLVWEWGTNAGNGPIASLGLTHSDTGSFFRSDGNSSNAMKTFNPFVDIGCLSRSYNYSNSGVPVLAIDGNVAYSIYMVDSTTVEVFKTPINNTKFKLQGGTLLPLSDYTQKITVTIQNYNIAGKGGCYYYFDFTNQKLFLFGVPTEAGARLLIDEVDLSNWTNQTSTQSYVDIPNAKLWKFRIKQASWNYNPYPTESLTVPVKAMVFNNKVFVYGVGDGSNINQRATKIFSVDLSNYAVIGEVDTSGFNEFTANAYADSFTRTSERFGIFGELIVHDSFVINGDKTFQLNAKSNIGSNQNNNFAIPEKISSPVFGLGLTSNMVSVNKLYLGTKWTLDSAVTKNASQSMTVEYTLTEV